jgi:hypothetical protein
MTPFLTLYTPTYKRPQGLARNFASVAEQSIVGEIEQIVIPDHIGHGIPGMFARVGDYAPAVHGQYVHLLGDDDVLAGARAVEEVRDFAKAKGDPDVIVVRAQKGGMLCPLGQAWPPVLGGIDLGCLITRTDIWLEHCRDYGRRYEGDYDYARSLFVKGRRAVFFDFLFCMGGQGVGRPELEVVA